MSETAGDDLSSLWIDQERALRRLAIQLVGDAESARDLVQDSLVRAIQKPPREPGALRAWLGTVLRRLAIEGGRREERRGRADRAAARSEALDAKDAVLRFETANRIAAAVDALAEPGRTTLILRYFEGLEPAAIARRLGLPAATVRSRLSRALAEVRARLEREFGEDGLRRCRHFAGIPVLIGTSLGRRLLDGLLGAFIMSTKLTKVVGLACLLLGLAALPLLVQWSFADDDEGLGSADDWSAGPAGVARREGGPVVAPRVPETEEDAGSTPAATRPLPLRVAFKGAGALAGRTARLCLRRAHWAEGVVSGEKELVFDLTHLDEVLIDLGAWLGSGTSDAEVAALKIRFVFDHPLHLPLSVVAQIGFLPVVDAGDGPFRRVTLQPEPCAAISGRVIGPGGPLAGAQVGLWDADAGEDGAARQDAGEFARRLSARARPAIPDLSDLRPTMRIGWLMTAGERPRSPFLDGKTAADGRFHLRCAPGRGILLLAAADHHGAKSWSGEARANELTDLGDLELGRAAEIRGRLHLAGRPLAHAKIACMVEKKGRGEFRMASLLIAEIDGREKKAPTRDLLLANRTWRFDPSTGGASPRDLEATTDADGCFVVGGLEPGPHFLQFLGLEGGATAVHPVVAGSNGHWIAADCPDKAIDFALPAATLSFDFSGAGDSTEAFQIRVIGPNGGDWGDRSRPGRGLLLLVLANTDHEIEITHRDFEPWTSKQVSPEVGETAIVRPVLVPRRPGPVIRFECPGLGAAGARTIQMRLRRIDVEPGSGEPVHGSWLQVESIAAADQVSFDRLGTTAGSHEVQVDFPDSHVLGVRATVELRDSGESMLRAPLLIGGRLRVSARTRDGFSLAGGVKLVDSDGREVAKSGRFRVVDAQGTRVIDGTSELGPAESERAFPPGEYSARFDFAGREPLLLPVRIVAGEVSEIEAVID